jgi:hypothetical protein
MRRVARGVITPCKRLLHSRWRWRRRWRQALRRCRLRLRSRCRHHAGRGHRRRSRAHPATQPAVRQHVHAIGDTAPQVFPARTLLHVAVHARERRRQRRRPCLQLGFLSPALPLTQRQGGGSYPARDRDRSAGPRQLGFGRCGPWRLCILLQRCHPVVDQRGHSHGAHHLAGRAVLHRGAG